MEQSQNIKTVSLIVGIVVIITGLVMFLKYRNPEEDKSALITEENNKGDMVVVENTPQAGGTFGVPAGFPEEIPLEKSKILESATTRYPDRNARQLSISYRSGSSVAAKYAEYKAYMEKSGYFVTEGGTNSDAKAIFGTKEHTNLSVVISGSGGSTLVQLSYLEK